MSNAKRLVMGHGFRFTGMNLSIIRRMSVGLPPLLVSDPSLYSSKKLLYVTQDDSCGGFHGEIFNEKEDSKCVGDMVKDAGNSTFTRWDKNWLEFLDLSS